MITKFSILKVIAIFILTTAIAAESFAQAPKPTGNKSQESIAATIKALSTDWSTAMLKGDASILERIWATDSSMSNQMEKGSTKQKESQA